MTTKTTVEKIIATSEIADMAGVERSTVSNWKKRYEDFPAPVREISGNDVYDRGDIVSWLQIFTRRRLDQAIRIQKEVQVAAERAEVSVEEAKVGYDRVKRLRK